MIFLAAYEPYQRQKPVSLNARPLSDTSMYITWRDPSLGDDQLIRDSRFYTLRYYSDAFGARPYMNVTDLRATINDLEPDTEYNFEVRVMDMPYRSHWSEAAKNRTMARRGKDYHKSPKFSP